MMLVKTSIYLILVFASIACDFTSPVHKKILKAQSFIAIHKYQDAINLYKEIIKDNPHNDIKTKIYYQIGELYSIQLSEHKEAQNYFEKIKETSIDPLWLVKSEERIGEISFVFLKDYDQAITSYKKLYEFTPKLEKSDFYQYRLALSRFYKNDFDGAMKEFLKIQNETNHQYFVQSFYNLGLIHFHKKEFHSALKFWNEHIKRESKKASIVQTKFLMANIYETTEKLNLAYNLYYEILGEFPNTQVIQNRLNAVYARRIARRR